MGHGCSSDGRALGEVVDRAGRRMGRLPVQGRYHGPAGRAIEEDYILESSALGTGYNGTVISAVNRHTGVKCAVKSFRLQGVDGGKRKELASEVEVYLSMDHPHVARLMEVYESEREVSLVMECCAGGELYDRVAQCKVFAEEDAALATWQMLLAVNYIHKEGVVHRDLKLENWLYDDRDGQFLKLIDFGFSKFFQKGKAMEESLGTISYVAPEVLAKSYSSGSCDLWSLGVIVFILLAGYMPFDGSNDADIIRAIRRGRYEMRESRWAKVSPKARDFVRRLLVVDPLRRFTAEEAMAHPWIARCAAAHCGSTGAVDLRLADAFVRFSRASRFQQACMQMMAWSLPLDERRKLRDAFFDLDKSHSGVIRLTDLEKVLSEDLKMPKDEYDLAIRTFRGMDIDGDGDLHFSDFLAAMMATKLKEDDPILKEAFRHFDTQNCSYITPGGLRRMLRDLPEEDIGRVFREADADRDGRICLGEFVAYLCRGNAEQVELTSKEAEASSEMEILDKTRSRLLTRLQLKVRNVRLRTRARLGGA